MVLPRTYVLINRERKIQINKFTGISALKEILRQFDFRLSEEKLKDILNIIKSIRNKNHWSEKELKNLIKTIK